MISLQEKVGLGLSILITCGYLYCLDWPQSLQTPLREPPYNFSSLQYNLIYSVTSLPLVFFSIPIGMLIDKLPLKYSVWFILGMQLISQLTIAMLFFFTFEGFYYAVLAMRMLFGITTETSLILQSLMVEKVIHKNNLDLALNLCYSVPLFFEAFNSVVTTQVFDVTHKMQVPLFIGAGVCLLSLLAGLAMLYQVRRVEKAQHKEEEKQIVSGIRGLKELSWEYWVYIFTIFIGMCSISPFLDNLTDLLNKRFNMPYTTAGLFTMIPCGISPLFSIMLFYFLKKYQKQRRLLIVIVTLFAPFTHLLFAAIQNTTTPGVFEYILIGVALLFLSITFAGFLGVLEASVSMIVSNHLLGIAYGGVAAVIALSMSLMPILNGLVLSSDPEIATSYFNLQYVYIPLSTIYLGMSFFIKISPSPIFMLFDQVRDDNEATLKESLLSGEETKETLVTPETKETLIILETKETLVTPEILETKETTGTLGGPEAVETLSR